MLVRRFAYDAYGNLLAGSDLTNEVASAITSLLFSGEQTDKTGLQYLRARYYDARTGRFNRLDPFAGNIQDPLSLHKYLYTPSDPINYLDPSGEFWGLFFIAIIAILSAAHYANAPGPGDHLYGSSYDPLAQRSSLTWWVVASSVGHFVG